MVARFKDDADAFAFAFAFCVRVCVRVGVRACVCVCECRRDPDLARQLRRAASSVVLNIAEGSSSQGKNRNARYYNALGSAKEVRACLEVAIAFGYIESVDEALVDELERIIATLINLIV